MSVVLTHVTHRAMACEFVVYLPPHAASSAVDATAESLDILSSIESRLTVYDPHSEVSRINRFAGQDVRVSHATAGLVARAVELSRRTGGAFDITAGPLIDAWGFGNRKGQHPSAEELSAARRLVDWQKIDVSLDPPSVRLQDAGMKINLGAIGKGDALDRVVAKLTERGVSDFLIHAGASSVVARGHQDEEAGGGWPIGLSHPTVTGRTLGHIRLHDQAMSTSGSGRQFFHYRGQRYGHVLDPRTGRPAGGSLSVTVVTDTATAADALATAMFVMDDDQRRSMALPAVIVDAGRRQNEVTTRRLGEVGWEPVDSSLETSPD